MSLTHNYVSNYVRATGALILHEYTRLYVDTCAKFRHPQKATRKKDDPISRVGIQHSTWASARNLHGKSPELSAGFSATRSHFV